ncbi:MAG: preprotein translocase subunit SecA [Clostridia bacterium]|nr:preprotein translocase subunit SecA [Clostridia bacterium]
MSIVSSIFGTYSQRQIKKLEAQVNAIEALSDKYKNMPDDELRQTTEKLKKRYSDGETLDMILPDAFAAVRETADRVLGKRPFRVQLIGDIVLHQGRIAEMKTGEGKTLVATMPAYLNAIAGKGVHIITVNDYLARVGAEEMGRVYGFLGMTTGLIVHGLSPDEKKIAYNSDITYGTNNEFGFDYLRDNMVIYKNDIVQRGHNFAIVDEVDSILIDEARTPLIISGEGEESTSVYDAAEKFARSLKMYKIKEMDTKESYEDVSEDYIVDEKAKNATLTANGIRKAEQYFGVENLSDAENSELLHHINQAIRAHGIMKRDVDYVVKDDQVIIVDSFTGRLMHGRRYSNGLHQAIEAKEHVQIEKESRTLATITFQNYFRLYSKLSGMTGTALTEEDEFREIYNLDVIEIPTNKPMIRRDYPDAVYKNKAGKINAIVEQIKECYKNGQPVLVGTVSIDKSELLSHRLKMEGIPHNVLNAKQHEREAEIVAQAGKYGAVTISTNMAGRGTDIMLGGNAEFLAKQEMRKLGYADELIAQATGSAVLTAQEEIEARQKFSELNAKYKAEIEPMAKKICSLGGLFIIGTERHESRRIDNQLRGRAGRQGDPGTSRFYLSLEDDLMRLFGGDRITNMIERLGLPEDQPIDAKLLSNAIESAQKRLEGMNFQRRKTVLEYDDVMNQQRQFIYSQRREVLDGADIKDKIVSMIRTVIENTVRANTMDEDKKNWNFEEIRSNFLGTLCFKEDFCYGDNIPKTLSADSIIAMLNSRADKLYEAKEQLFVDGAMREVERIILLHSVDKKWMDHLDMMDDLRESIGLQAYAQRNPLTEYRIASADMYDEMIEDIRCDTVRRILAAAPRSEFLRRSAVAKIKSEGFAGESKPVTRRVPAKSAPKVGRNDPCPCGSGKKYKKCCGANDSDAE